MLAESERAGDDDFAWVVGVEAAWRAERPTANRFAVRLCCPACPAGRLAVKAWRHRQRRRWIAGEARRRGRARRCPDCRGSGYLKLRCPSGTHLHNGGRVVVELHAAGVPLVRYVPPEAPAATMPVGYSSRRQPAVE